MKFSKKKYVDKIEVLNDTFKKYFWKIKTPESLFHEKFVLLKHYLQVNSDTHQKIFFF